MKQILTLLLVLALALPALAQESDAKARLVEEVLQLLDLKALTATAYDIVVSDQDAELLSESQMTPEERVAAEQSRLQAQADRRTYRTMILERLDHQRYAREVYAPLLSKAFSTEELQQLLAFMKTPAGAKVARLIPEVSNATAAKAAPMLHADLRRLSAEMMREDRKKNPWKVTVDDMRAIASVLDTFAIENNGYPAGDFAGMKSLVTPEYSATLPEKDVWGQAFVYVTDGTSYRLISGGADKQVDDESAKIGTSMERRQGATPEADIILQNGVLVQSPGPQ
ncbi:MAG TPA: DUF2059 domain-containing protein [Thermoanaerobaculia bacterium]|nr:DUF2059 domain-containing protein [Thermoanaerobaculia bacterium]